MWCAKRWQRNNACCRQRNLCSRVHNGGRYCFGIGQRRKNATDALCEHRLSCTWWTDEQQMVCASCSYFECVTCRSLTTHIFHINAWRCSVNNCSDWCGSPSRFTNKTLHQMRKCLRTDNFIARGNSGFAFTLICNDHYSVINCRNKRHDSSDRSQGAV